ncbi:tripartite tricarboxylate transporter TctB family protein [Anderseniella sp. Alg231-50]|uniref:tripartite tricarboxylate transporter TctB family protein n=1 Tax=Anderseniella sp. Alg231-50 TaxID=1922226 RepID=UPI000D556450
MRFNDSVFGLILIAFAIAEISYARTFPRLHGQDYGPDLFPVIIGAGLMLFGGILIARGWARRATQPLVVVGDWAQDRGNVVNVIILLGSIVFYIVFSTWLGFIPTALLIQSVLLVRLGSSLVTSVVIATISTMVIHTLFAKLLLVPLPWGLLLPLAW